MCKVSPSSATQGDSQMSLCVADFFGGGARCQDGHHRRTGGKSPQAWLSWCSAGRAHPEGTIGLTQRWRWSRQWGRWFNSEAASRGAGILCACLDIMLPSAFYQTQFDRMAIPASPLWGWNLRRNQKVSYNYNFYSQQARCFAYREMISVFRPSKYHMDPSVFRSLSELPKWDYLTALLCTALRNLSHHFSDEMITRGVYPEMCKWGS